MINEIVPWESPSKTIYGGSTQCEPTDRQKSQTIRKSTPLSTFKDEYSIAT